MHERVLHVRKKKAELHTSPISLSVNLREMCCYGDAIR